MSWRGLRMRLKASLAGFELDVEFETRCETVGLFGPSGAGKTTVLECLAGWRRAVQGEIRIGERVLLDSANGIELPPAERRVGYVPQEGLLFPHWTVRNNVLASGRAVHYERVLRILELDALQERSPAALSGGERQRVALARALCSGPELLLLDEPLAPLIILSGAEFSSTWHVCAKPSVSRS